MEEIIGGRDLAEHDVRFFRVRAAQIEQQCHARNQPEPEELAEQRAIMAAAHGRLVKPGQEEPHQDRREHRDHAHQLGRNEEEVRGEGAQDRVERIEIPFGHDERRGRKRVCLDVIVGMAERVRHEEHEQAERDQHDAQPEPVLGSVVRVERDRIALGLDLDPGGVGRSGNMQRPDVQDDHARDHERQQEMQ